MSLLSRYLDPNSFARVRLAFAAVGYEPPRTDEPGNGAYVSNVVEQYRADMSTDTALAVVRFGLHFPADALTAKRGDYTLAEVAGLYGRD